MEEIETFDSNESKQRKCKSSIDRTFTSMWCHLLTRLEKKRKEEFSSEKEIKKSDSKRPKG